MKPMNVVKRMSISIYLLSFLFLTQGCVNDDLSVCGVRLAFNYTEGTGGDDNKFASDVRKANVYVFDAETGLFINEYAATMEQLVDGHILPVNLNAGVYDIITWGNIGDQFEKTAFVPGVTTFSDARLTLNVLDNTLREYPDSMYYGAVRGIEVVATDLVENQEIPLKLKKNNKKINVTTRGLYDENSMIENPDSSAFHCMITSKNGSYKFDNYPTGEPYTYMSPREQIDSADYTLRSNFLVLREFNDNSLTDSKLRIVHGGGSATRQEGVEEEVFLDVSLTKCLETVAVAVGSAIEDIDEFDIEIIVSRTNGSVSVTINDWNYNGKDLILH